LEDDDDRASKRESYTCRGARNSTLYVLLGIREDRLTFGCTRDRELSSRELSSEFEATGHKPLLADGARHKKLAVPL
jgi:hypothetical protein